MRSCLRHYLSLRLMDPVLRYRRIQWHGLFGLLYSEMPSPEMVARRVLCPAPPMRIIKDSRSVTAMLCRDEIRDEGYFYKRYNYRGFWHNLRKFFQFARPYRCLAAAMKLRSAGFQTPQVLLAGEVRRWGFWPQRQYLLSEQLEEGFHFLPFYSGLDIERRMALFRWVIEQVARLHKGGMEHGDLSFRNMYGRFTEEGGFVDFGVIDLDGFRLYRGGVPRRRRLRELARVISSAYRLRVDRGAGEVMLEELVTEGMIGYRNACGVEFTEMELVRYCHRFLRHRTHRVQS